jgi:hypothetical protein
VVVPTVCNNVSLVTREPEEDPLQSGADEPIDISPAAGPTPPSSDVVAAEDHASDPLEFTSTGDDPGAAGDGPAGASFPGPAVGGDGGGGGIPCCGSVPTGPIEPGVPPVVTPSSPVPEAPAWSLLLGGMALVGALGRPVVSRSQSPR